MTNSTTFVPLAPVTPAPHTAITGSAMIAFVTLILSSLILYSNTNTSLLGQAFHAFLWLLVVGSSVILFTHFAVFVHLTKLGKLATGQVDGVLYYPLTRNVYVAVRTEFLSDPTAPMPFDRDLAGNFNFFTTKQNTSERKICTLGLVVLNYSRPLLVNLFDPKFVDINRAPFAHPQYVEDQLCTVQTAWAQFIEKVEFDLRFQTSTSTDKSWPFLTVSGAVDTLLEQQLVVRLKNQMPEAAN